MTEQHAMNWYHADCREQAKVMDNRVPQELREPVPLWSEIPEGRKQQIRERVRLVTEGEIPRSQMGPGDLCLHYGHPRLLDKAPPDRIVQLYKARAEEQRKRHGNTIYGYDMRKMKWWDTLQFGIPPEVQERTRLFGSDNIGRVELTNLQIGGMLACDQSALLQCWYLSFDTDPELIRPLEESLGNAVAVLNIGDQPQRFDHMIDLWRQPQPLDVCIPIRQNFSVTMEFFGREFDTLKRAIAATRRDGERSPFGIRVCLEGWQIRSV